MNDSFDLPSEPRLSNSALKNRPIPPNVRTRMKQKNQKAVKIGLDDAVPLDDSNQQLSEDDNSPVIFREKNPFSSNRTETVPLSPTDTTLFYVTSSTFDDDSNSSSCSDQPSLSQQEDNNSVVIRRINRQKNQSNNQPSIEPMSKKSNQFSTLIDDFSNASVMKHSTAASKTTDYVDKVRENSSNCRCADCNSEHPTIAIMSWLLVICKKCAAVHRRLTSNFLRLQSLITTACDPDLIDLLHDIGNKFTNNLLENNSSKSLKPTDSSSDLEREQYIRKKYIEKIYLQPYQSNYDYTQEQLNQMLYENVETSDCKKTLHLIILGANVNYSEKRFAVADHAERHQQIQQLKILLVNGGLLEYDLTKTNSDDINESAVYLSTKHGVLKEFLTRYENDRLKIYSLTRSLDKPPRCLFDIDLNNVLAICNQSVNAVSLKCRFNNSSVVNINSQCILIVDDQTSSNEYVWVFPNELERSVWIREIIKRQYPYYQLIYPDFLLLMKLNIQEGINAEKQQVIAIVYSGRFVICSDTIFDEVDLKKYSSLTYQKSEEFTGVILCLVSNRFLYLSSPIVKLMDMLYSCLRQAIKVKTLNDLNKQILTSQNIPVIVERFINFIFEYGLQTKGIYRQAGQETKIKQLLNECLEDPFTPTLTYENYTEHDVASALKRFLRQLDIPLLGTSQNYHAWLRSTVDRTTTTEQLIQYYRALLKHLKKQYPIHYSTLRTMLIHIHTVATLADRNGMTLSNLVSTFTPCLVTQGASMPMNYTNGIQEHRKLSLDDNDLKHSENEDDIEVSSGLSYTPSVSKLKRNKSFHAPRHSLSSISSLSHFPLSSSYVHVTPSIQADLQIMFNLCKYYRELFDITNDEIEYEKTCIETLISMSENPYIPRLLDGAIISVYFESRADELNGYAMKVFEDETTADIIIDKLLKQIDKSDCFFWALFEVIIDQNLERPMYLCENISEVLYRYRTYLSRELNRQATFVVKLNYVQFEKERLQQRQLAFNKQSVQCEYFDFSNQRWTPCVWIFEKAVLKVHRIPNNINDKTVRWKSNPNEQVFDHQTLISSWSVENIYLYIGADYRVVQSFDMNEYRVLTILPPEIIEPNHNESRFGTSFRFVDRNQMFSWYLELVHINGHDKWTRRAPRTLPDGVNYLPLQNYHTSLATKKKSDILRNKLIAKSCDVASNFCKQLRK